MKSFKSFLNEEIYFDDDLTEAVDDASKEHGVSNNTKGVLHEILTGKHLNNGNHMEKHVNEHGETPVQTHDRLKKAIHQLTINVLTPMLNLLLNILRNILNQLIQVTQFMRLLILPNLEIQKR